jgi:hypothetical protein
MAIGKRSRSAITPADQQNPFADSIESTWQEIRAMLAAGDGRFAEARLSRLRETDRPIWNAVHWRTEAWLVDWFRGRGFGRCDNFPNDDFSREALTAFLVAIYPGDPEAATLESVKLPRILQELRALAIRTGHLRQPEPQAAVPPPAVRREVAAAVPGSLFDDDDD